MPYPDLGPSPTFWRCPGCGSEALFRASGTGTIICGACGRAWSAQQLVEAHAQANPPLPSTQPAANT
jgi:uncharacterized Zn finger protein (UPF0148 family)